MQYPIKELYIDENLSSNVIGGIFLEKQYMLLHVIFKLQQIYQIYEEIKYTEISHFNYKFYITLLECVSKFDIEIILMQFKKVKLHSYIDFIQSCTQLHTGYKFLVFLDYISCPNHFIIEEKISQRVDNILYVLRENSKGNIFIQIADLLLGVATRDISTINSPWKKEVVLYYQNSLLFGNTKKLSYSLPTVGSLSD